MKKRTKDYVVTVVGIVLLGVALYLIKSFPDPQGIMLRLPFVLIGIGSGAFGLGMGNLISHKVMKNNPKLQKQFEIDQNDERNVIISNLAKAKAFDLMTFMLGALMLSFALMGTEMVATLLLVCAYLFIHGYKIYYSYAFNKQM
jgi:hypothetical protein